MKMILELANRSSKGDLYINLAKQCLENHQWGMAVQYLKRGISKGYDGDPHEISSLFKDVLQRLDMAAHIQKSELKCLGDFTFSADLGESRSVIDSP
jgi:uncharacterized protein HemY